LFVILVELVVVVAEGEGGVGVEGLVVIAVTGFRAIAGLLELLTTAGVLA
jgi:hypothetical protein